MISDLILLRHGRTAWNAQRRFQGQSDPPLDEVGRAQAREVAVLLRALEPTLLVSSDLARARQTAEQVAAATALPVRLEPRLRERSLGHWEQLTREQVQSRYPDEFADWVAGRDVSRRGGETRAQVAVRALAAVREVSAGDGLVVLVTHSATAMAVCNALLGLAHDHHLLVPLANCHWTHLSAEPADGAGLRWRLRAHNIGVPGVIVPLPVELDQVEDASDAEA